MAALTLGVILAEHAAAPTARDTVELRQLTKRFTGLAAVQKSQRYIFVSMRTPHLLPPPLDPLRACVNHPLHQSKRDWETEVQQYRHQLDNAAEAQLQKLKAAASKKTMKAAKSMKAK